MAYARPESSWSNANERHLVQMCVSAVALMDPLSRIESGSTVLLTEDTLKSHSWKEQTGNAMKAPWWPRD